MEQFTPRWKLWLEADARLAMSDYRVRLLEIVADTGSLSKAAEQLRLSYRRAWGKVRELEENLGFKLVQSEVGGSGGGHTDLTPEARAFVEAYKRFQERAAEAIEAIYAEELGSFVPPPPE